MSGEPSPAVFAAAAAAAEPSCDDDATRADEGAVAENLSRLLEKAVTEESASHVEFLLKNGARARESHFTKAVMRKDADKVRVLLLHQRAVAPAGGGFSEAQRRRALFLAIRLRATDVVAQLLYRHVGGVCPNFASDDEDKQFPIHMAVSAVAEPLIVRVLLQHGADANARNLLEDTPLHLVGNHTELTRLLLDYAGDPDYRNSEGLSALHVACQNNCLDVCRELDGADPNIADNDVRVF